MTQYLNPFSGRQFLDINGDPYDGAKLFAFVPNSTTEVILTKDQAGLSNHTNPIILNARGEPADGAGVSYAMWQTGGQAVDLVLAPSDDTDPPVSAISTWEDLAGINDATLAIDQWVSGPTPTFVSTTSFTLVGDQTSTFHIGRRLKLLDSGGTDYGVITNSVFTSLTTVTVVLDSGVLDSGLSSVSYGLLTSDNHSIPTGATLNWTGEHTHTKTQYLAKGADIVSANDLVLGTDGNYFDVTGTTTINGMSEKSAGTVIRLHFDGSLILKHDTAASANFDSLDLSTSSDIVTQVGDEVICISDGEGNNWRCNNYTRKIGSSIGKESYLNSFEYGETGWTITPFSGGSSAISTTTHINGEKSLSVTSTVLANGGATVLRDEYWLVTGGRFFGIEINLWASVINISSKAELVWYDEDQAELSRTEFYSSANTPTTGLTGQIRASKKAPDTARWVRLECVLGVPATGTATGTLYLDGVIAGIHHNSVIEIYSTGSISAGLTHTRTPMHGLDSDNVYVSSLMAFGGGGAGAEDEWSALVKRPDDKHQAFYGAGMPSATTSYPAGTPSTGTITITFQNRDASAQSFDVMAVIRRQESS